MPDFKETDLHKLLCVYKALVFDISREVFDSKGYPIIHEKEPINQYELCNKKYVDDMVSKPNTNILSKEKIIELIAEHVKSFKNNLTVDVKNIKETMKTLDINVNNVFSNGEENSTNIAKVNRLTEENKKDLVDISNEVDDLKEDVNKRIANLSDEIKKNSAKIDNKTKSDSISLMATTQIDHSIEINRLKYQVAAISTYDEFVLHLTADLSKSSVLKAVKDFSSHIGLIKDFYRRITVVKVGFKINEYDRNDSLVLYNEKRLKKPFELYFIDNDNTKKQFNFDMTPSIRDRMDNINAKVFDNIIIVTNDINYCLGNSDDAKNNNKERGNPRHIPTLVRDPNVPRIDIIIKFLLKLEY